MTAQPNRTYALHRIYKELAGHRRLLRTAVEALDPQGFQLPAKLETQAGLLRQAHRLLAIEYDTPAQPEDATERAEKLAGLEVALNAFERCRQRAANTRALIRTARAVAGGDRERERDAGVQAEAEQPAQA